MNNQDYFLLGKRILIAEDDFVYQKLITHALQTTGAYFDIVSNGLEAIEAIMKEQYDLVLMDIGMPILDGYEATKRIRANINSTLPIVAMTGWNSKEDILKFAEVGIKSVLPKPFGLAIFYQTLKENIILQGSENVSVEPPKVLKEMVVVDLSLLNEFSQTDNAYKKTIINMFLDTMPETIQQIETAFQAQNWDQVGKSAHYAKSSLSVISVEDLRTLVAKIESNAKKFENLHQIGTMIILLKLKYQEVVAFLQEELKKY